MASDPQPADPLASVRHRSPQLSVGAIDYGILRNLTGFSVKLAWILGHALVTRELGDGAITPHRFSILEMIGCNPGLQQIQLARALALSRPATTLMIDFWEQRGCVERRRLPGDRRSFGVFTTAAGEGELERLRPMMSRADEALTMELSADEVKELRRLLRKIHR
jgi:DNA-binding MarR family transcriptional regulator